MHQSKIEFLIFNMIYIKCNVQVEEASVGWSWALLAKKMRRVDFFLPSLKKNNSKLDIYKM